jgi:hypothetical protein
VVASTASRLARTPFLFWYYVLFLRSVGFLIVLDGEVFLWLPVSHVAHPPVFGLTCPRAVIRRCAYRAAAELMTACLWTAAEHIGAWL